jgi:hypothetical protein
MKIIKNRTRMYAILPMKVLKLAQFGIYVNEKGCASYMLMDDMVRHANEEPKVNIVQDHVEYSFANQ